MSLILQWILTRTWKRNVLNPASVMNTHIWIVLMIQHVNIFIFSSENRFCLLLYPYYMKLKFVRRSRKKKLFFNIMFL